MSNPKLLEIFAGGELPPKTPITGQNNKALYTRKSIGVMIGLLSQSLNRKLNQRDVRSIQDFLNTVSSIKYEGMSYAKALTTLSHDYLEYVMPKDEDDDTLLSNYEINEAKFLTNDESLIKFSSFPKTHTSHVDEERREMRKSEVEKTITSRADADRAMVNLMEMVKGLLSEENKTAILSHLRGLNSTYQSVQIPRQSVRLDSRNRNISTSNLYQISWNLQFAGQGVEVGNVKLKRPIQEVIRFNVKPFYFWLVQPYEGAPAYGLLNGDLHLQPEQITMQVTEFNAQGVQASIPRGGDINKSYEYHISFNPRDFKSFSKFQSRFLLTPLDDFIFMKPFAKVSSVSLRFFYDFTPLMILPDTFTYYNLTKVGNTLVLSGMYGGFADQYKAALYYGDPNYLSLPVKYPIDLAKPFKGNTLNFKTPLHFLNVSTGNSITDTLLTTDAGWLASPTFLTDSDLLSLDDSLTIDLTYSKLASQPDFSITNSSILVCLDALSLSMTMEFVCLEMPSN